MQKKRKSICCSFSVGEFALPQKSLYNIKTKVLVLRIGDIGEMKIEHMQLHLFHQHWLCFINASVSWRHDIEEISHFHPPLHSFILSIKRCSARFISSSYGINTLGRQNEQLYFIYLYAGMTILEQMPIFK